VTVVSGQLSEAPGLAYEAEFITPAEERVLLWHADAGEWSDYWSRRTQFYGIKYNRGTGRIDSTQEGKALPSWCESVSRRLVDHGFLNRMPNQIGVNEYLPGQGIASHVDYLNGAVISLSLGSGCVMDITEPRSRRKVSLWLAPRSIVVLSGTVRNVWEHGIARRLKDIVDGRPINRGRRVSITFRDVNI